MSDTTTIDPLEAALEAAANRKAPAAPASAASAPQFGNIDTADPIEVGLAQAAAGKFQQPQAQAQQQAQQAPGFWDQAAQFGSDAARGLGLLGRATLKGITALPGRIYDVPVSLANTLLDKVEGSGQGWRFPTAEQSVQNVADSLGLPQPRTPFERVQEDVGSAVTGAALPIAAGNFVANGIASPTARAYANLLRANPGTQLAASATGAAAAGGARELGVGPLGQFAAGFAGTMVPVAAATMPGAVRTMLGANSPAQVQAIRDQLDNFSVAGATPTVGQATQNRAAQGLESTLAKVPGGSGPIAKKAADTAAKFGQTVNDMADALSPGADPTLAGQAVKEGISGDAPNSWANLFRTQSQNLYSKLDNFIPSAQPVPVTNTQTALNQLTAGINGAPAISAELQNGKLAKIADALQSDAANGVLPYQAVKQLRTMIGEKLSDFSVIDDVTRAQWSKLYGALSSDMEEAAKQAGPQAEAAFDTANSFYRDGMNKLSLMTPIIKSDIPERVFSNATAGAKNGPTMVRTIMDSLPQDAQKTVTAAFLKRMGQAVPSQQNDAGDVFSLGTFLTNWSKLDPQAKAAIFNRPGYPQDFGANLDKVAAVASNLRAGSSVYANASNSGSAVATTNALTAFITSALYGHFGIAGTIAGTAGASNLMGRWMTSPSAVRWLAQLDNQPVSALPAAINSLAQQAAKTRDPGLVMLSADAQRLQQQQQPKTRRDQLVKAYDQAVSAPGQ
jgi:hypothetical protein